MSQMPVEAEVVLTADNSQYDQAMVSSASTTDALGSAVDNVSQKIHNLTKSAGRSMVGITAADIALIGGATAAYASYEQQISRLQAQSAIVGRSRIQENKLLTDYTNSVKGLRKEYGTTTGEAAQLTSQIAKLTDPRRTREVAALSKVFTDMSLATGESSTGLSDSLIQLQKTMGTEVTAGTTRKYADQIAYLAQQTGIGAQGLVDFTNQLAPVAQLLELNQTQVTGVATAFAKAGQDGFAAANAFNTIVSNISYAAQSGSPELAKYASLVGLTTQQFEGLSGSEKILRVFEQLNRMGPSAITKLNEMGLDGTRTLRAIYAVSNQSGGLRNAIAEATEGMSSDASSKGAAAATRGIVDEFAKLRQELQMTAENLGDFFDGPITKFLQGIEKSAGALNSLTSGPFGDFLSIIMAATAPVTAFGGGVLLMAGALLKLAGAFTVLRNSGSRGFIEGLRGGARIVPEVDPNTGMLTGRYVGSGGRALGESGTRIANNGSWLQRTMYNGLNPVGNVMGGMFQAGSLAYEESRRRLDPGWTPAGGSPWSRAAGVAGWGVRNVLTPQLDQMRYMDETKRMKVLSQHGIITGGRLADQYQVAANAAAGTQQAYAQALNNAQAISADPKSTAQDRVNAQQQADQAKAADLMARTNEAMAANALARDTRLNESVNETTRGFRGLSRQLMDLNRAAFVGGVKGVGAAANFGIKNTIGYGRLGGIAALVGGTALASTELGSQSNALTMGMTGAGVGMMFSPMGAAIGGAIGGVSGLAMDVAKENDDIQKSGDLLKEELAAHSTELSANAEALRSQNRKLEEYRKKTKWDGEDYAQLALLPTPLAAVSIATNVGEFKNTIEGIFGDSNIEEEERRYQEAVDIQEAAVADARALAEGRGMDISNNAAIAQQQLEEFLGGEGGTALNEAGLTFEDYQRARELVGKKDYIPAHTQGTGQYGTPIEVPAQGDFWSAMRYKVFTEQFGMTPEEATEIVLGPLNSEKQMARIVGSGRAGGMLSSYATQLSAQHPESYGYFQTAVNQQMAVHAGMQPGMALSDIEAAKSEVEQIDSRAYEILQSAATQTIQGMRLGSAFQGRTQRLGVEQDIYTTLMQHQDTDEQKQAADEQRETLISSFMDQGAYFQQLLLQQREFNVQQKRAYADFDTTRERMDEEYNISRSRAQEDYHLQRKYQEQDYQLSRKRAQEDYDLSRERSQEGFQRSMFRNQQAFNIARRRQEQDYHHQVQLMVEQSAQAQMNIYQRIGVERTASSNYILYNAQDQLEQMQGQADALDQLRGLGLSDDAIQQLGLTSAENAQQAIRLAAEMANDPKLVEQMNKAFRQRLRAARELVTDESSKEWEEFTRQYRRSTRQATEDFERSVRQARKDFAISMEQMSEDFQRAMTRGAEDYETMQKRQSRAFGQSMQRAAEDYARSTDNMTEDFNKSMRRAQADLERSSEEISGSMTQILNRAIRSLTGNARQQAIETRRAFRELRQELGTEGDATMILLSQIFGFKYTPKTGGGGGGPGGHHGSGHPNDTSGGPAPLGPSAAGGAVLPGFTKGVDDHHFYSPTGGNIHLSGGEAIMVPEWVQAVGGAGPVMEMNRRARQHQSFFVGGTMPVTGGSATNVHPQGYEGSTYAADINKGSGYDDYGLPIHPWKSGVVASLIDLGDASYGRYVKVNHDSNQWSLYAHMSKFGAKRAGDKVGTGDVIGYVGDYGNTGTPPTSHLHFEIHGGTVNLSDGGIGGGGGGLSMSLTEIMKDSYPDIEAAAREVGLGGPGGGKLFRDKRASKLFNRHLRAAWNNLVDRYGPPSGAHGPLGGIPNAPANLTGNKAIGKAIADRMGWDGAQWDALHELWMRESGWSETADNPTSSAYGIPQALMALHDLPAGYVDRTTGSGADMQGYGGDPEVQIRWGLNYIKDRYGSPVDALAWHDSNNWYAKGGIFSGPEVIGVGEKGPEMVLPLDDRGAAFISDILSRTSVGNAAKSSHLTGGTPMIVHNANTYRIDRSTNFSGPITVQANNPTQFISQMQARQRLLALSQSAMGGRRV